METRLDPKIQAHARKIKKQLKDADRRERMATEFMAAIISKNKFDGDETEEQLEQFRKAFAKGAVLYADALMAELDGE